jgi:hypothetical protein
MKPTKSRWGKYEHLIDQQILDSQWFKTLFWIELFLLDLLEFMIAMILGVLFWKYIWN